MGKPFWSGLGPEFDRPGTIQPYLLERMKIYDVDREYISDQFVGEEPQQRENRPGQGIRYTSKSSKEVRTVMINDGQE